MRQARFLGAVITSIIVTLLFGVVLILWLTRPAAIPASSTLDILVGVLGSNFNSVVQYWIGSSIGSHVKDEARDKERDEMLREKERREREGETR
jgi:membrane protein DedA with SNARE-associated domain